ncbi:MAG: cytochrome b N-terminal domain-containing protein [Gemmatimonadetes bacterium]|nr:cytochrome b N-terminal domain-containing protein [Gemmatimonadota bacterium]
MRILERPARRALAALDALATSAYGWAWNPLHQTGTVAVAMLLALLATGLYLVLVYRLGAPAASVARIAADPWLGAWIRSLHRYASDLFVVAAALHAFRLFAQRRSWGPRTLAWISGCGLFLIGLACAWTGYVMAWDTFGERLAREGARLFDVLPIFSEPLSRIFAGDRPVPGAFFFVNLFVHIVLPLAMGIGLWLHVSRLARPTLLPPKRLIWAIVGALTVAAIAFPAALGPAADSFTLAERTPVDLVAAWWLPLSERLPAGVAWSAALAALIAALLVPRVTRRPREGSWAPSHVDPRLCTGCNQCPQDCPWDAITMVPRDDDRPSLVALVDPARCVSCGICAGSCAPMGVGPAGLTGRDQLTALRSCALTALGAAVDSPIVAVCCAQAPVTHVAALRARGALVHQVPCVGNLHSSVVELLVRQGAPGVIVCGCPPRDCVGREGPKWLAERFFNEREAELQPRVERDRVRIATMAGGDLRGTLAAYDDFARHVAALRRPEREANVELQAECAPPALAEDAS